MSARTLVEQWRDRLQTSGDLCGTMKLIRADVASAATERAAYVHALRAFGELVLDAERRVQLKDLLAAEIEDESFGVPVEIAEHRQLEQQASKLEQQLGDRTKNVAIDNLNTRLRQAEKEKKELEREKGELEKRLLTLESHSGKV